MIKSFKDKDSEKIFYRKFSAKVQEVSRIAYRKLMMLDAATKLIDLRAPPGNKLEALRGDREGQHSIRINDRWRLCFVWRDGNAYDVELVDYH